jgi:hypothetical protein
MNVNSNNIPLLDRSYVIDYFFDLYITDSTNSIDIFSLQDIGVVKRASYLDVEFGSYVLNRYLMNEHNKIIEINEPNGQT